MCLYISSLWSRDIDIFLGYVSRNTFTTFKHQWWIAGCVLLGMQLSLQWGRVYHVISATYSKDWCLICGGVGSDGEFEDIGSLSWRCRCVFRSDGSASSSSTSTAASYHSAVFWQSLGSDTSLAGSSRWGHHRAAALRWKHGLRLQGSHLTGRCAIFLPHHYQIDIIAAVVSVSVKFAKKVYETLDK